MTTPTSNTCPTCGGTGHSLDTVDHFCPKCGGVGTIPRNPDKAVYRIDTYSNGSNKVVKRITYTDWSVEEFEEDRVMMDPAPQTEGRDTNVPTSQTEQSLDEASFEIASGAYQYYETMTLEFAQQEIKALIEEWDYAKDPHGYCHSRPALIELLKASLKGDSAS